MVIFVDVMFALPETSTQLVPNPALKLLVCCWSIQPALVGQASVMVLPATDTCICGGFGLMDDGTIRLPVPLLK